MHVPAGPFVTVLTLCALMLNDELSFQVRSILLRTQNFVAVTPARVTRSVQTVSGAMARLPEA